MRCVGRSVRITCAPLQVVHPGAALRESLRPVLEAEMLPTAGTCPDVVRALSQKIENDLDAKACADMGKHVESCPACEHTCDAMKDALRACRSSASSALTPEIQEQVRATIARWLHTRARVP